jgi:hypothetical protein
MDYNFQMPSLSVDPLADAEEQLRQAIIAGRRPTMLPRTTQRTTQRTNVGGTLTNNVTPGANSGMPTDARGLSEYFTRMGLDAYAAEPDVAGLQQYAKTRAQDGESAMLNALAAGYAGPRFQPVQAQYLKRSMAAQEPLKVGNAGYITPSGEYVKDPTYSQDRKAEQFLGLGRQYAASADRADERADQNLLRRDLAENTRSQRDDVRNFNNATKLRGELNTRLDKVANGTSFAQTITEMLADPEIATDAIKQISLIFQYGKLLDPDSVVREAEQRLIAEARGVYESALNYPERIRSGVLLTPQQLQSIGQVAQNLQRNSQQRRADVIDYYRGLAQRNGLPAEDVLPYNAGGGSGNRRVSFEELLRDNNAR